MLQSIKSRREIKCGCDNVDRLQPPDHLQRRSDRISDPRPCSRLAQVVRVGLSKTLILYEIYLTEIFLSGQN